jgi:hypothetical protein
MLSVAVTFLVSMPAAAAAQTEIDWASGDPLSGTVVDGELLLDIEEPGVYPLLVIEEPGVGPPRFTLDGTIRYEEVAGTAYLEMWTVLADESRYFTRTLAESGPLGSMRGTSDTRPLSLPFELGEGGPVPDRLEINLVTEGSGRFWLGPLTIVPIESDTGTTETSVAPSSVASVTTLAPTTTGPVTPTVVALGTEPDDPSLLLVVAVIVLAGGFGGTAWLAARRRRLAAEQRRLDAMDSIRR